jgi:hypothetical protein
MEDDATEEITALSNHSKNRHGSRLPYHQEETRNR